MTEQEPEKLEPSTATIDCPCCGHRVRPRTVRSVSMVAGTVVALASCPECASVLSPGKATS